MNQVTYRPTMSSSDAIIWNIEKDPQLRSTVMSVWLLDEAPTPERMAANTDRMVAAIPRLRQRVLDARPRPLWDPVEELDLSKHYIIDELPAGSGRREVLDYAEEWVRDPFDPDRPLWKLALLTGLADGKAAIVIKVHHAIADGMGMVLMLAAYTDFERHPAPSEVKAPVLEADPGREVFSSPRRLAFRAKAALKDMSNGPNSAVDTLKSAAKLVTPHRTPHSELMTERSEALCMDTRTIAFDDFKETADASGVTLNDLFVSVIADTMTSYHDEKGADCPRLRVHVPVDIRTGRTANLAGNQFVPARVSLDLRAAPGKTRRTHISMQLADLCEEPALGHINTVSAAIQQLGKPISRWIIGGMMKGIDVLASNVPGPDFPLYVAGAKIEEFYGFGPPAGAAVNFTLFSYDGDVHIGFTSDNAAIADRALFLKCLDDVIATTFTHSSASDTKADLRRVS